MGMGNSKSPPNYSGGGSPQVPMQGSFGDKIRQMIAARQGPNNPPGGPPPGGPPQPPPGAMPGGPPPGGPPGGPPPMAQQMQQFAQQGRGGLANVGALARAMMMQRNMK